MGRTLSKEHLPPGATAYAWGGELYIPGDDGKVRNMSGQEVELPADFPSDEQLAANRKKAQGAGGGSVEAPLDRTIASTTKEGEKGGKAKESKA